MRIWDVNPGYLNRNSLLGEHRELHGMYNIITKGKSGYTNHPETIRWQQNVLALINRHELLVSELNLRGYKHHSPLTTSIHNRVNWPETFIDNPGKQFEILSEKYQRKNQGRIPLPKSPQQIWAQHKYSILARDPEYYRSLGKILSQAPNSISINELANELVITLRQPPDPARLFNALQHMWRYISGFVDKSTKFNSDSINAPFTNLCL